MNISRRQLRKLILEILEESRIIGTENPSEAIPSGLAYQQGLEKERSNYKKTMSSYPSMEDLLKKPSTYGEDPVSPGEITTLNQAQVLQRSLISDFESLTEPEITALSMGSKKAGWTPDVSHTEAYYRWSTNEALGIKDDSVWQNVYKEMSSLASELASNSIENRDNMSIDEIIENEAWGYADMIYDELDGRNIHGYNDDETLEHIKDNVVKIFNDYDLKLRLEEAFDQYDDGAYP